MSHIQKSNGVPSSTRVFLRLLVGGLGTPKLAQIFAYGKWLYPYIMLLSDIDQRCLKTRNSEDECTFQPNIFASIPKITQKPHFGGPFNVKPIIQRALCQSHVNGATMLKLYGNINMNLVKYMGCVKIFPLGVVWRTQVPSM